MSIDMLAPALTLTVALSFTGAERLGTEALTGGVVGPDQTTAVRQSHNKPERIGLDLVGPWMGHASGEEVRSRPPLLSLKVKHSAKFFFYVNSDLQIEGQGSIQYDLYRNTEGVYSWCSPKPPDMLQCPPLSCCTRVFPIPCPQFDAPHLKNGKELRYFKCRGHATKPALTNGEGEQWRIYLEEVGDFTRPDGAMDNQLTAAWEVNYVKEEKQFPCWSQSGHIAPRSGWSVDR